MEIPVTVAFRNGHRLKKSVTVCLFFVGFIVHISLCYPDKFFPYLFILCMPYLEIKQ